MDFELSEEQAAVKELAGTIIGDGATHERLKQVEVEAGDEGPFDAALWGALAEAGLLGIGIGEDVGGAGLDFVAICLIVEAVGRHAAYVPVVECVATAMDAIERCGTAAQRTEHLPGAMAGERILTAATAELVGEVIVEGGTTPATTAIVRTDGEWRLDGTKACVPSGLRADLVLVPASILDPAGSPAGVGVFLVDPNAAGVTRIRQDGPAVPEALIELDGVNVGEDALLGGSDADGTVILLSLLERATAARCVQEAGVCAGALALLSEYTSQREQFGKVIATFQAVGQRAADAYVDTEAIRLTAWQAAWRLSAGLSAAAETAVAKFWAADGGQRVVHAATHLHGGVGVDRDYPLHRYFLLTRQIELTLGGAHSSLRRLGAQLAAEPAA